MSKIKLVVSLLIFSVLLGLTSAIKNQTRIIEKKIYKADNRIHIIEKDLHETELDYFYLSSPKKLSTRIKDLSFVNLSSRDVVRHRIVQDIVEAYDRRVQRRKKNG